VFLFVFETKNRLPALCAGCFRKSFTIVFIMFLTGLSPRANHTDCHLLVKLVPTFVDRRVSHIQRGRSPRLYYRFSAPEPLLFLPSSSWIVLARLNGPRSTPATSQKIWKRWESIPDLWICSQELWPLDHKGVLRGETELNALPLAVTNC
jgi:hypothetical protein